MTTIKTNDIITASFVIDGSVYPVKMTYLGSVKVFGDIEAAMFENVNDPSKQYELTTSQLQAMLGDIKKKDELKF